MIEELKKLSEAELETLYNAPVWVTILIAGADNKFDKKELQEAISVTHLKQKRARQALIDYYKEVSRNFESNLKGYISLLPQDARDRTELLSENLAKLNLILPKLDKSFSTQFYESIKDLAQKVANASGGIMGFLATGYEESKLLNLKMIKDPSI